MSTACTLYITYRCVEHAIVLYLFSPLHFLVTHSEDRLLFASAIDPFLASAEGSNYTSIKFHRPWSSVLTFSHLFTKIALIRRKVSHGIQM